MKIKTGNYRSGNLELVLLFISHVDRSFFLFFSLRYHNLCFLFVTVADGKESVLVFMVFSIDRRGISLNQKHNSSDNKLPELLDFYAYNIILQCLRESLNTILIQPLTVILPLYYTVM